MSTQVNQFLMWGIRKPYSWHKQWEKETGKDFSETFESFQDDSAFESTVNHKDGIFCLFDGRDGRYIIIGRVLAKTRDGSLLGENEPIMLHPPTKLEKEFIRNAVVKNFGIDGDFRLWFITHYR